MSEESEETRKRKSYTIKLKLEANANMQKIHPTKTLLNISRYRPSFFVEAADDDSDTD